MLTRSQEAAIKRAMECEVQTISAFGKTHPVAAQAARLVVSLQAAAEEANQPKTLEEVFTPPHPGSCKCEKCGQEWLAEQYKKPV